MRRRDLFLSPTSLITFGLSLTLLFGWYSWRGQTLFSPGRLSAGSHAGLTLQGWQNHAEFEAQCALCHQPLRAEMAVLCQDCHANVAEEVAAREPLHGLFEQGAACLACHTEHLGADADLSALARPFFDHETRDFSLARHTLDYDGRPLDCAACHSATAYAVELQNCQGCHSTASPDFMAGHTAAFGAACLACHDGHDRYSDFAHASTGFPLDGLHAPLACAACHAPEKVALETACHACHAEPEAHFGQFGTDCATCHTTAGWSPARFDHAAGIALDCQSCHLPDRPAEHYPGQCSTCHATDGWVPASFSHLNLDVSDCQSCHLPDRPAAHYPGQCSACHTTAGWLPATFDHAVANATDCQSCHLPDRPAAHYPGQCSACHTTSGWLPATFNHSAAGATDCQSCHLPDRPANHYNGQCSACHSTSAWRPASFNHAVAGATDCQSCHTRPANHFPGQCSQCHTTRNWEASFNHSFPMNHGDANGRCESCHVASNFSVPCTNCHSLNEISGKHNEEGIFNIAGNCLNCHADGEEGDGGGDSGGNADGDNDEDDD